MNTRRKRIEKVMRDSKGMVVGGITITHATGASPLPGEWKCVWENRPIGNIDGVFIKRLHITPKERGCGYGTLLLEEAAAYAQKELLPLYVDVRRNNTRVRKWLRTNKFTESIFWHNSGGTLMVRYRYF